MHVFDLLFHWASEFLTENQSSKFPVYVSVISFPAFYINHNYLVREKKAQNNFDMNNSLQQIYLQQMNSKFEYLKKVFNIWPQL